MPLQLQEADFKDGKAIANVYISAFFDDPFLKSLYPGMPFEKQVAGVISRWPNNYGDISAHHKIVVDIDSGEVVSYSKWSFAFTNAGGALRKPTGPNFPYPLDPYLTIKGLPENFRPELPSTPEGLNDPFASDFTKRAREIRDRILGVRPQLRQSSIFNSERRLKNTRVEDAGNSALVSKTRCCKLTSVLGNQVC